MYNEYALTGRVRHDQRVISWQGKRDALNPLLKIRVSDLEDKFSYNLKLRNEAWGPVGEYDREAWKNYTETEIRPVLDALRTARSMFLCFHEKRVDDGDCLYCPDCGAADYGLGWDCVSFHAHTIANIEVNGQK